MQTSRTLYRFLIAYLFLHLLMSGIFVVSVSRNVRDRQVNSLKAEMKSQATAVCKKVEGLGTSDPTSLNDLLDQVSGNSKLLYSIVDETGAVLADAGQGLSSPTPTSMEIIKAQSVELGFAEREDKETQEQMLACAMQCNLAGKSRGFVHLRSSLTPIEDLVSGLQRWLWLFSLMFGLLAGLLMIVFTSKVLQPLNLFSEMARRIGSGSFERTVPFRNQDDEWGELADAFRQMQKELSDRESLLRESNHRMQAVLGSMIEGVLSTDANGLVLTANKAACEMLSVADVELLDRNLLDVIRYPELRRAIEAARSDDQFADSEFETTDRTRRLLKAHVARLPNDSGELAIVLHDVTDLRALETMRRDFVANVSHELKTPLSSIKAYAETLKMGAIHDVDKNVQFVEQIESQAEMLNLQIQDLIELARIESGKAARDVEPISINQVCQDCVDRLASHAEKRKVELRFEPDRLEPIAMAEHNGLATIVTNLLTNAIHYTPAEGSVTVRTTQREGSVTIDVVDTGIGIAADEQLRVFERFYRVDKARSRDMGGTGLGLSIVKHLTQSFRGKVKLKSRVGKGSTFRIKLPSA